MGTDTNMKKSFFLLALVLFLGGCLGASETASYRIGPDQAITLLRQRAYPWDDEYIRSITVMSMPKCTLRYKMPLDNAENGEIGDVAVYDSGDGYFVLKDKAGQYLTNLADCTVSIVDKKIVDPGELKGTFVMQLDQPPRFDAAPAKPKPKAPAESAPKNAN